MLPHHSKSRRPYVLTEADFFESRPVSGRGRRRKGTPHRRAYRRARCGFPATRHQPGTTGYRRLPAPRRGTNRVSCAHRCRSGGFQARRSVVQRGLRNFMKSGYGIGNPRATSRGRRVEVGLTWFDTFRCTLGTPPCRVVAASSYGDAVHPCGPPVAAQPRRNASQMASDSRAPASTARPQYRIQPATPSAPPCA